MSAKRWKMPWFWRARFCCPECQQPMDDDRPVRSVRVEKPEPNTLNLHVVEIDNFYQCPRCGLEFTGEEGSRNLIEKYYPQHLPQDDE